ncbi:MAG TPA: phage tail protein [Acidimicrobiales bacterium]|nr:phage tail protein [Acidimicrobiales bacterium]
MSALFDTEFLGSQFALELDGVELARFTGCSGLTITAEVVTTNTIGPDGRPVIQKRPGRITYEDIVLKRGFSASNTILDWLQKVADGTVERKTGSIVIYDPAGVELDRWNFENAWPSKWSASDLDAGTDDIMIEELTITHEFLKRA